MQERTESAGILQTLGEGVGGFLAGIPPAISSFFSGVGQGAGIHGLFDWAALLIGLSLLLSVFAGFKRGRIVGPVVRGAIAVALMGWAVA